MPRQPQSVLLSEHSELLEGTLIVSHQRRWNSVYAV